MAVLKATWEIFRKDLSVELRTGEVVLSTGMFSFLVAVLASLSFYIDRNTANLVAPGVLWIAIAFAGVLALGRSWARERDNEAFRALLLSPIPRAAIYLGKGLSVLIFLAIVELLLVVVVAVLFSLELGPVLWPLALLLALGSIGFVAAGNLFAAMGVRTSARDLLLSVAMFPVIAPALLCGVVATRELLGGASFAEIEGWLRILAAFDLAFATAGVVLFEPLISD